MKRPHVLITNDDGIDSYFLRVLVEAHLPFFRVSVAAPLGEQSWIGRAFSRRQDVHVSRVTEEGFEAWAIDGTPSDCVNIALGHLLPEKPDVVISGINIGFNITMPLLLSSGTLAGAIEGAAWGVPSLAFSLELPDEEFDAVRLSHGKATGTSLTSLQQAAIRAVQFTREQLDASTSELFVHNINFPRICSATTPVEKTIPGDVRLGCVYHMDTPSSFRFQWNKRETPLPQGDNTDAACILRGNISHTALNYNALGR